MFKNTVYKFFATFFYLDLRSLALLRICIGALLLGDLIDRGRDLTAMYTDFGLLPRSVAMNYIGHWGISIHFLNGSTTITFLLFLIAGIFAIMVLIGYRTTLATIISWFLLISLQNRNPMVLSGADQVVRMVLFWAMFLPWHARFSVDAALHKYNFPTKFTSAGTVAYILQVISIYIFTAILKDSPEWRTEGTAIYYALSLDLFRTNIGSIFYYGTPWLLRPLTHAVFLLEAFGTFLLFIPYKKDFFRFLAVLSFVGLHVGIGLTMMLGIFPWVCVFAWLAILPTGFWDKLFAFISHPKMTKLTLYYDYECGTCFTAVRLIHTFLLLPQTTIASAETNKKILAEMQAKNSWIIVDHNGTHHYEYDGFVTIAKASPLLFLFAPLLAIKPMRIFGNYVYQVVNTHRKTMCSVSNHTNGIIHQPLYTSRKLAVVIIFFTLYVLWLNITTLPGLQQAMPLRLKSLARIFSLYQPWNMFSPKPSRIDGWYVIVGRMADDSSYDIYNNRRNIIFDKPPLVIDTYKNARWQKYLSNISYKKFNFFATYYAAYLCRDWNRRHSGNMKMTSLTIINMTEISQPHYQFYQPHPLVIKQTTCK